MTVTINGTDGITLNNGSADGAQVTLSSSGYNDWNIDNYNGTLRAYNNGTEQFKVTNTGNLQFNSGYGSPATAYGCRAWVNFNGTGTVAIRASGNVSSITDNGTGNYTVNFTTAMPDANYSVAATGDLGGTWYGGVSLYAGGTQATTQVQIATHSDAGTGTYQDFPKVFVHIFR